MYPALERLNNIAKALEPVSSAGCLILGVFFLIRGRSKKRPASRMVHYLAGGMLLTYTATALLFELTGRPLILWLIGIIASWLLLLIFGDDTPETTARPEDVIQVLKKLGREGDLIIVTPPARDKATEEALEKPESMERNSP